MGAVLFLLVASGVFAVIIAMARASARRGVSAAGDGSRGAGSDSDGGVPMWSTSADAGGDGGGHHGCDAGSSDSGSSDCGSSDSGGGSD